MHVKSLQVKMTTTIYFFFLSRTLFCTHRKPAYNLLFLYYLYHEDLSQVLQFISVWHSQKASM